MLLGPGRWGTESPDLGIPVHFAEINRASILCEIVTMRENLVPDVSLGTHFLNELIEMNILYIALFPAPNRLTEIVSGAERWQETIRVVDTRDVLAEGQTVLLLADASQQKAQIVVLGEQVPPITY
jgi:pyruvate, water dikinase